MKTVEVPNCNKQLVANAIRNNTRNDGRKRDEVRERNIVFGREFGTCIASLGNTRVLAKVTCDIAEPMGSRPSEGMLKISVDLSPMAAPHLVDARGLLEESVEIVRLLERSVREAKCVDMESLCLVSGDKCWRVRVDLVALNTEGNLIEVCSLAMISALAHFKRPEVTIAENKMTIHSLDEKHPIPLTLLHYPFCVKYCFFNDKKHYVVDPIELEESVCEGYMVVSGNSYREITTIHVTGNSTLNADNIMLCCSKAIERIKLMTDDLKNRLQEDKLARQDNPQLVGFAAQVKKLSSFLTEKSRRSFEADTYEEETVPKVVDDFQTAARSKAYRFERTGTVGIGEGGENTWEFIELDEDQDGDEDIDGDESNLIDPPPQNNPRFQTKDNETIDVSSDEEVVMLDTSISK